MGFTDSLDPPEKIENLFPCPGTNHVPSVAHPVVQPLFQLIYSRFHNDTKNIKLFGATRWYFPTHFNVSPWINKWVSKNKVATNLSSQHGEQKWEYWLFFHLGIVKSPFLRQPSEQVIFNGHTSGFLQYFSIFHFFVFFLLNGLTSNMLLHFSHSGVVFKCACMNSHRTCIIRGELKCFLIFKFSIPFSPYSLYRWHHSVTVSNPTRHFWISFKHKWAGVYLYSTGCQYGGRGDGF